jgi:hypothetical protein
MHRWFHSNLFHAVGVEASRPGRISGLWEWCGMNITLAAHHGKSVP